uniref:Uncharacterized protein n=1 Tax=Heterorhabditis bacteriophora TaxID=37862 RepID=A0A1I7W6A9_HETBA
MVYESANASLTNDDHTKEIYGVKCSYRRPISAKLENILDYYPLLLSRVKRRNYYRTRRNWITFFMLHLYKFGIKCNEKLQKCEVLRTQTNLCMAVKLIFLFYNIVNNGGTYNAHCKLL